MRSPFSLLKNIGPAIIVAAVVLGPGSILTSSKAGASYGFPALAVLSVSTILMIAMVALAAGLGVVYDTSPCTELTNRLGRPVAFFVALVVFVLVAIFQSSNNIAVIGGLKPLFGEAVRPFAVRASILAHLSVIFQAVGFFRVESCPTQAVLPLVGLATEKVIRDRYKRLFFMGGLQQGMYRATSDGGELQFCGTSFAWKPTTFRCGRRLLAMPGRKTDSTDFVTAIGGRDVRRT
ncbi:MAG: divalent metal cation transporter [Planctomycetota bacterium]